MRIGLVHVGKTLSMYRMQQGKRCLPEDVYIGPSLRRNTVISPSKMLYDVLQICFPRPNGWY